MGEKLTPPSTQTPPRGVNCPAGDAFLGIVTGGLAAAVVVALVPVESMAAGMLTAGALGLGAYKAASGLRQAEDARKAKEAEDAAKKKAEEEAQERQTALEEQQGRLAEISRAIPAEANEGEKARLQEQQGAVDKLLALTTLTDQSIKDLKAALDALKSVVSDVNKRLEGERTVAAAKAAQDAKAAGQRQKALEEQQGRLAEIRDAIPAEANEGEKARLQEKQDAVDNLLTPTTLTDQSIKDLKAALDALKSVASDVNKRLYDERKEAEAKAAQDAKKANQLEAALRSLKQQFDGQNCAIPVEANEREKAELEKKRADISDHLGKVTLADNSVDDVKLELKALADSVAKVNMRLKGESDKARKKQKPDAQRAAELPEPQQNEPAKLEKEEWRKISEEAKAVLPGVERHLKVLKRVRNAYDGPQVQVVRDYEQLKLAADAETPPEDRSAWDRVTQRAQRLKGWVMSIDAAYPKVAKDLELALLSDDKKGFAQELSGLMSALLTTDSQASDITKAYDSMFAQRGPWTPEGEPTSPKKVKKTGWREIEIKTIGLSDLNDPEVLNDCRVPEKISWKPEPNGQPGRLWIYEYSNGVEIHVHRNATGRAVKAHTKLTANKMVAGTSEDNDIDLADLPGRHGIARTQDSVEGIEKAT